MNYREKTEQGNDRNALRISRPKDAKLIEMIRNAGYRVDAETTSYRSALPVYDGDRVIATITRNTGTGWRGSHEGWRLHSPAFKPQGDWHQRYHRAEPDNPRHWGGRNYKVAASLVAKLTDAKEAFPDAREMEIAAARESYFTKRSAVRSAEREMRSAFKFDNDFVEWVIESIPYTNAPDEFRDKAMEAYRRLVNVQQKRVEAEREWEKLKEIEGDS